MKKLILISLFWTFISVAHHAKAAEAPHTISGAFLAMQYAENREAYDDAYAYAKFLLKHSPKDSGYILSKALNYAVLNGDYKAAETYADQLMKFDHNQILPSFLLALKAAKVQKWDDVLKHLDQLPEHFKDHFFANLLRAWVYVKQEDYKKAVEMIEKGKETASILYYTHLAMMIDIAGERKKSLDIYKKLLETESHARFSYVRLIGDLIYRVSGKEDALTFYKQFETQPILGSYIYPILKNPDQHIVKNSPYIGTTSEAMAHGLTLMGIALSYSGDAVSAATFMHLALYLEPQFDFTRFNLILTHAKGKEYEQVIQQGGLIDKNSPYYWGIALQKASSLIELKQDQKALDLLDQMIKERPKDTRALVEKADYYRLKEDFKSAEKFYTQAIQRDTEYNQSQNWILYYARGICFDRQKKWQQAEKDLLRSLEIYPQQADVLNYLGYSWIEQGKNLQKAEEMVRKAVELKPKDGYIADSLGWALYKLGRYDEAITYLEKATEIETNDPVINDHLGDSYWRAGRKIEARFQWSKVLNMNPDEDLKAIVKKKLQDGLKDK